MHARPEAAAASGRPASVASSIVEKLPGHAGNALPFGPDTGLIMENSRKNYRQAWGNELAARFRRAWNGTLPAAEFSALFQPRVLFHFHDVQIRGIDDYQAFIAEARDATEQLDLVEELVLSNDDKVLLFFRWASRRWHPDIVGGNPKSNYCKVVFRVEDGRIAEIWEQSPDFLFLFGKRARTTVMRYPDVVGGNLLTEEHDGIYPTEEPQAQMMRGLFQRMNDCFMNRSSLRHMKDIQHEDIVYDTGGNQGSGVQSWKTFAYGLHTCLGQEQGTRFEDLYLRQGDRMRVFLRATTGQASPYILQSAEGLIAAMRLTARDGKIQALETQLENYIQFLDTDFPRHPERLKQLFQGQRVPVIEAPLDRPLHPPLRAEPVAKMMRGVQPQRDGRVAIVGMAGRFPQCDSIASFWQALQSGRSLISEVPEARANLREGSDIRHAGFIGDVDLFDAAFFQMLPAEAEFLDPQQRLMLQAVVHAIEDGGHALGDFSGPRTGLFIATLCEDYQKLLQEQGLTNTPQTWSGNENAMFPAKIARFLNIQGACQFVNAECTSSLAAIHEASRAIREGRLDQAIVGASNLLLHPYGFVVRRNALLTDEPVARLFGKDSRGQLRGEAGVAVVLKSLSRALADGDRIHGLVAGSAVNNSGRTLSLVAGNVEQQTRVMTDAWRDAGVQASDVSLIECHASGVRGGDFAEIAAIKQARVVTDEAALPCKLATAKGAIGHSEAASGLTALVKVLLQLRHGEVVGIHGLEQPDPELRIDPRQLDLVKANAAWQPVSQAGVVRPRVAGINGFAAGGYNAHVVIEEYLPSMAQDDATRPATPLQTHTLVEHVIVLSAQSESGLKTRLRDLRAYVAARPGLDLPNLAYSLQRRDALRQRAALVVASVPELLVALDALIAGETVADNVLIGRKPSGAAAAFDAPVATRIAGKAVAQQWCEGRTVPWSNIRANNGLRLLEDLPLYPFEGKRYWLPERASRASAATARLHPLLHENISTLSGQRYRSTFDGGQPLLADHRVQGHLVLPGVAYLEMVRAAVGNALLAMPTHQAAATGTRVQLRNVVWLQPIALRTASESVDVRVELASLTQGQNATSIGFAASPRLLSFEVSTIEAGERRLHCQGQASQLTEDRPDAQDIDALLAACADALLDPSALYATYESMGIAYGPTYRAVTALHRGVDAEGRYQVLAELRLPTTADGDDACMLHPSMADAAVHAALALAMEAVEGSPAGKPPLPFALESVEILQPTDTRMWAWVRHSPREADASGDDGEMRVQKLDIDLFDAEGRVCMRMQRFSSRTGDKQPRPRQAQRVQAPASVSMSADNALRDSVLALLKEKVAAILQVTPNDVDPQQELSEYGFDSINLTELGGQLNETLSLPPERPLNPTIFFEHPTLASFAGYLVRAYRSEVEARHGVEPSPVVSDADGANAAESTSSMAPETVPMPAKSPHGLAAPSADVAIIGISGRFPMAEDVEQFWDNLASGRDCISEVPADRWDWRAYHGNPLKEPGRTDVRWGGFIDGVAEFDPLFFGISPREAELMDPQQRLLMQHVWLAIEDAGYNPRSLSGSRTGVFLATANSGYSSLLAQANVPIEGSTITGAVPSVGPNRISYFLNLHGPSEPIETACSSSLVAIHRAIAAMQTGSCDMAIVGGVNTVVSPDGHIGFRKAGMLCEDGRCKTFSAQANGYVRGEGIGILVLKKLHDAQRADDPIYAVIKGSAENHGGRANSLTAPNPNAQADLLIAAYAQAGIDPRSVGYIEAHGTGTELGDPIEVNGLKNAFAELYEATGDTGVATPHCGLGSVKSNIGHLELAAGVAGVIKVLMQFRHATLASSLHAQTLNPYIQLDGSPFYVVQQAREWIAPRDDSGRMLPRRAGVSSFGFGGANAHVVLEEFRQSEPASAVVTTDPQVVLLSARTPAQLQQSAAQLLQALTRPDYRGHSFSDRDLRDIAYTLQVGRDAMDERLGMVVHTLSELRAKLQAFIDGSGRIADVHRGSEKSNRDALAIFREDDEMEATVAAWLARGKIRKVLELWVKGLAVDWERLHAADSRPRRVHLPGYAFARDRYWVPTGSIAALAPATHLHPLIHRNVSDFAQQRYVTTFSGREFFLRDHVVMQHKVLPAVAYLEMARAAVGDALGGIAPGQSVHIANVVWLQPVALTANDQDMAVHVALSPNEAGEIAFQIFTQSEGGGTDGAGSRLHCHGLASLRQVEAGEPVDIAQLRARCGAVAFSTDEIYAAFDGMGLHYGPAHRGIRTLHLGEDESGSHCVLARLQLPDEAGATLQDYMLHPAVLDAALQAGIGFILQKEGAAPSRPPLPFHLRELDVVAPCTVSMWACVRPSTRVATSGERATQTLDIDLCDDAGRVCARLRGFASRSLPESQQRVTGAAMGTNDSVTSSASVDSPQSLMLAPVWISIDAPGSVITPPGGDVGSILAFSENAAAVGSLRQIYPGIQVVDRWPLDNETALRDVQHLIWIVPASTHVSMTDAALIADQRRGVLDLFRAVKSLLAQGQGTRNLSLTVITTQGQAVADHESCDPVHAAVHGMLGSLAKELPAWRLRVVDLPQHWSDDSSALLREALAMPFDPAGTTSVRRAGGWYRHTLMPYVPSGADANSAYRSQGVYVVIGGAGGIGEVWSEYMLREHDARIIWIGRREADESIAAKLDRLAAYGTRPRYISADATRRESLQTALDAIKLEFPRIDGVVHSALVLKDQTLANMGEASFSAVLAAKVDLSVCMAQVFQAEPLDFVMFFSSLVAFAQPPGQGNYVAGCAFKDAFARQLAREWPCAVKVIDWGYWGSVGVAASDAYRQRMARLGVGSIEPAEAMQALEVLLREPVDRMALVSITRPLAELAKGVYASFLTAPVAAANPHEPTRPTPEQTPARADVDAMADVEASAQVEDLAQIENQVIAAIKQLLSDALKVDLAAIDIEEPFTDYGLDSITGVHLAQALNDRLNVDLDITLFFDHSTVRLLTTHLLQQHPEAMTRAFARVSSGAAPVPEAAVTSPVAAEQSRPVHRFTKASKAFPAATVHDPVRPSSDAEPIENGIAIVGLSGCFPGADDAEQLWQNLVDGRDCVSEVPAQRWDWRQVVGDPTQAVNQECFRWGAFIDGVDRFDAEFFGVTPDEAAYMSPQQRLLLTHVWKAIEDAAIAPKDLARDPTGVFIATVPSDYLNAITSCRDVPLMVTGLSTSMIPNRISYSFNLRGPSEHCDTACSSTLVALHRAVQSIRNGECRQAIVGAVNLLLTPDGYIGFESMGYLSPTNRMAAFQAEASGFVRAEGVGAVVLKPLRQAVADGHRIHAVIRGTGVAHGGHTVSMTTPNGAGMKEAIRQAYQAADIDPRTVSYVEGHGIASPLGDAIEISALKSEYQRLSGDRDAPAISDPPPIHIGSAKPCLGYAEVASGMVSLIKVIMAMRHRTLPGVPRFTRLHDNISLKHGPFRITAENQPWPALHDEDGRAQPRRAAINNFGFSGVNAHLVLEEYLPVVAGSEQPPSQPQLFVFSARSRASLVRSARQMLEFLETRADLPLRDIAHTLQSGREAMEHRLAFVAEGRADLIDALSRFVAATPDRSLVEQHLSLHVGRAERRNSAPTDASVVEQWLVRPDLQALAEYWVRGGDFAWDRLQAGAGAQRLSLPGHPLESTRYWVSHATGLSALHRAEKAAPRGKRHHTASPA